jgi:hypothetical protein
LHGLKRLNAKAKDRLKKDARFAVTSGKCKEMFERNFLVRRQKKTKKKLWKGKHEEAKQEKNNT